MSAVLDVRGVVKAFGENVVLRGVDVAVDEHRVVALIGGSGSGKSTLLRCASLLEVVDDGQVLLDGEDITDPRVDADAVRRRMGVVFQAYNLFPHLSVLDNVTLAPVRVHGRSRAEARDEARGCWSGSGWPTSPASTPTGSPAASSSGSPSPGPSPSVPGCCCWTRSPRPWTPSWWARCCGWSARSPSRA